MKTCTTCNETKSLDCFTKHKSTKDGIRNQCKSCCNKSFKKYYDVNKPSYEEKKDSHLKHLYGISYQEYLVMLEAQNYQCAICGTKDMGKNRKAFHVDHCHDTGKVRGLLCSCCNTAIGKLKEDITIMERAIDYVRFHKEIG